MTSPLFQVRDLLRECGMASAAQLARELRLPTPVVEDMLAHWTRRGQVTSTEPANATGSCGSTGCNSCGQCGSAPSSSVLYRWRASGTAPTPHSIRLQPSA